MNSNEYDKEKALLEELESYKREREKIKKLVGSIGGKNFVKKDRIINIVFLGIVVGLFIVEITTNIIPLYLSLEVAVLLISVKIVWLIQNITKMDHFLFWILNSIEFRINSLDKKISELGDIISGERNQ
ncbi:MAG: hypothetical protein DRP54_04045 [Spirochaetes bacterium]|nr:MAG: hypothetical protein DRP54_04045 [Spirochaetota bacterium]